ncbi:MAG: ligase-associated DNA damage response endonuclease PdeM [Terrimicrobiaceae bacterium]|nr:ligase-associated DNA damage response endonuclease PdeM [Terrimicrobiaceae bacterium]
MKTIRFGAEDLTLDPDRAVAWDSRRVLLIADTHFGKDATARALGMPVPSGALQTDLDRLEQIASRHGAREIWVLGDVFDSKAAGDPKTIETIRDFLARTGVTLSMVPGNHDRNVRHIAEAAGIRWFPSGTSIGPFVLTHEPLAIPSERPRLCGHVHPGTILRGPGRERLRAACFWQGRGELILPAFGTWTGLALIRPQPGDQVWAAAAGRVIECPVNSPVRPAVGTVRQAPARGRDLD